MRAITRTLMLAAAMVGAGLPQAGAQAPQDAGSKGSLTLRFSYKSTVIAKGEFKDRTTINQTATIVCPLVAGDVAAISHLQGPTRQQSAAQARLGAAAAKEVSAVSPQAVAGMKSIDQRMKACRASGKSARACGMEAQAAMQADPELLEKMGQMGQADPKGMAAAEREVTAAAGSFQPWFNEGCTGTMTVDNSSQLDDPTTAGPEPVVRTTGTRRIETKDTLVTVETDLSRSETRYQLVTPQASGFQREADRDNPARLETLLAIPVGSLALGPFRGPIQAGRHEQAVAGGSFAVDWSFTRGQRH